MNLPAFLMPEDEEGHHPNQNHQNFAAFTIPGFPATPVTPHDLAAMRQSNHGTSSYEGLHSPTEEWAISDMPLLSTFCGASTEPSPSETSASDNLWMQRRQSSQSSGERLTRTLSSSRDEIVVERLEKRYNNHISILVSHMHNM